MTLMTRKRRAAVRRMNDLARRRGDGGVALLPGVSQSGMHWLARDCGLGVSLTPTAGTLGPDSVTRPAAAWLAAYVESTASTPAAVDGPVGFLSDGCSSVTGPELVANTGGPYTATTSWASENSNLTTPGGKLRVTSIGNSYGIARQIVTVQAGKTYKVTFKGRSVVGVGWFIVGESVSQQENLLIQGLSSTETEYTVFIKATTNEFWFKWQTDNVIANSYTEAASTSCKASTASRHAIQNSGPNKPILRRGLVNGLAYSGDFSNTAWQKVGTSPTANAATAPDGTLTASVFTSTATGDAYIMQQVEGASSTCFVGVFSKSGANQSDSVSFRCITLATAVEDDELLFNFTTKAFTGTGTIPGRFLNYGYVDLPNGNVLLYANNAAAAGQTSTQWRARPEVTGSGSVIGKTVGVWRGAIFNGTLTPDQILAAGGIPLTTAIAASSSGGNYALEFDGTKQMGLSSVPFAASDDHAVVVGARVDDVAGQRTLYAHSNASNHQLPWIYYGTNGKINATYWDGTTTVTLTSPLAYTGQDVVVTLRRVGSTAVLRVNGQQVATASLAGMTSPALTAATLGGFNGGNLQHKGRIFGALPFKGVFSDAEVLVFERGVAALCPIPGALRF